MIKQFLSCDWGTSVFRLKLIEANTLSTISGVENGNGISSAFSAWKQSEFTAKSYAGDTSTDEQNRFLFFTKVIKSSISSIESKINKSLSGVPIVVSGMASSSLGMIVLPYKQLPFKTDGSDLTLQWVKASSNFEHDVIIISGVCSEEDVMRGEETQLVGSVYDNHHNEHVYIFPGTHSKHITVKANSVCAFKTYMTGELFALLSKNSTLAEAVDVNSGMIDEKCIQSFKQGVEDNMKYNLLHGLFMVRTRFLLQSYSKEMNYSYLSGLLIGYEVRDLINRNLNGITLVSSSSMSSLYEMAMQSLNILTPIRSMADCDATVKGQSKILSHNLEIANYFKFKD